MRFEIDAEKFKRSTNIAIAAICEFGKVAERLNMSGKKKAYLRRAMRRAAQ